MQFFLAVIYLHKKTCTSRYVYSIWIISTLIFATAYGSSFYYMLTWPDYKPIDTLEDFIYAIENNNKIFVYYKYSYFRERFLAATPETNNVFYKIGKQLNR